MSPSILKFKYIIRAPGWGNRVCYARMLRYPGWGTAHRNRVCYAPRGPRARLAPESRLPGDYTP
jgi:hypothetical protein